MTLRPSLCPYLSSAGEGVFSDASVALLGRDQLLWEASLLHESLPIDLFAFFGLLLNLNFHYLLRYGLSGLGYDLRAQAHNLLNPSPSHSILGGFQPKRCLKRESPLRADSSSSLSPSWSGTLALCTLAFATNPSVSTSKWRFPPRTF